MHTLAAKGVADDADLGRPRDADSAARLRDLAGTLVSPTTAPALVVAAVVHAELAAVAPFCSHNGLVARAAERLVLASRGVDAKSLMVPEAGHLAVRREYESNLRGYRDGGVRGRARVAALRRGGLREGRRGEPAQRRLRSMQAAPLPGFSPGSRCRC